MRINNVDALKEFSLRKKLTMELVHGIMDDIEAAGVVTPGNKNNQLGKAIMARINTFLMGDGCDRLPLDLGQ